MKNFLQGLLDLIDPLGVTRSGGVTGQLNGTGVNSKTPSATKLKTTVIVGGKEYNVYKNGSTYYYDTGSSNVKIENESVINSLKQNKAMCIDLDRVGKKPSSNPSTPAPEQKPSTNTGGGGTISYTPPKQDNSATNKKIAELEQKIYELEHPKVYSAQELADIYGIDYNEQNILKDYNKATNEYYDAAINEQNDLRTNYARNNARYIDQVTDAYLDSYRNAAPTAVGKGTLAANALSTALNANQLNASNDYGMMQSVNNLEEARKAELKDNPNLAKQYYNNIGTYLSGLSAELNKSDVKQYVDKLDAYSQMYAADRSYQSYLAQANAAKYAGLAGAASTNASTAANNYNSQASAFDRLWNMYYTAHGNDSDYASKAIANLLKTSTNTTGK